METSKVISTDKATVIIQENPQAAKDSIIFIDGQEVGGRKHNTLTEFFKAQPTALGTVQIATGVMVLLIGIVLTIIINYTSIVTYSGITYWGSFIHISAGSLSVAAQKKFSLCLVKASLVMNVVSAVTAGIAIILMGIQIKVIMYSSEFISAGSLSVAARNNLHQCVVKASLGMNVISAVTAGISFILMAVDIVINSLIYPRYYYSSPSSYSSYSSYSYINSQGFGLGIIGVLLVFCILQLIISIFVSVFACKATGSTDPRMVNVALNRGY
ncbi:uncharacterized protein [Garra rufa]|uniref:uncharacterized protein n=1 Tax=Garra rufa TaxID=137080 RepID=UPI003CCEEA90